MDTTKVITDTLAQTSDNSSSWIIDHIVDSNVLDFEPFFSITLPAIHLNLLGVDLNLSITKHVVFVWLGALIVFLLFRLAASSYKKSLVPKGLANVMEVLVTFIRDEIVAPTVGTAYTNKFLPFLGTIFFFILTCNFLGLLPYGSTATSNISVTASLAAISFIVTQFAGMKKNGVMGYVKGLIPHGVPVFLLPIMFVVEVLGLFTKPFALMIRLFANMTAGHVVIMALIGLIFILKTPFISPVSILFALFIYLLELLVALIQAYIFTMLSSLFIGMAIHQEH
ncbi:MAG: F0F1 ATP synthase subunit A [Ignavibacteria bacterium]|nr:F0F1 ATP synthase subunit A [Ignavibacteria bacterium]